MYHEVQGYRNIHCFLSDEWKSTVFQLSNQEQTEMRSFSNFSVSRVASVVCFIQWVYNMLKGINHFPLQPIWSDAIFLPEVHCRGFLPTIRLHHFLQWQSTLTISRMICRSHKQTRLAIRINSVVKYSLSHLKEVSFIKIEKKENAFKPSNIRSTFYCSSIKLH